MTALVAVDAVTTSFDGTRVLDQVSFEIEAGTIMGLFGPNGAGKTTLLNVLQGLLRPEHGVVRYDGKVLRLSTPHQAAARGIARTFQRPHLFGRLTVAQNMLLPLCEEPMPFAEQCRRAIQLLAQVGLSASAYVPASRLSGGQRKLVEIARVQMRPPRLLLLDEPFGGVHPVLKGPLVEQLHVLQAAGVAILLVSHDLTDLLPLVETLLCLHQGRLIAAGPPLSVCRSPQVIDAYLGSTPVPGGAL